MFLISISNTTHNKKWEKVLVKCWNPNIYPWN